MPGNARTYLVYRLAIDGIDRAEIQQSEETKANQSMFERLFS